jgi:hypothetical protein
MDLKNMTKVALVENRANAMINKSGLTSSLNNTSNKSAIDLIVSGELVDVQYSGNFKSYGDIRIDLFSAFKWDEKKKKEFQKRYSESWFKEIQKEMVRSIISQKKNANGSEMNIDTVFFDFMKKKPFDLNRTDKKNGKYINHEKEMIGVLYFIYNEKIEPKIDEFKKQKISKVVFVSTSAIMEEIGFNSKNFEKIWNNRNFQVNDKIKNTLNDTFESAFLAMSLPNLIKNHPLSVKEYSNISDFNKNFKNDFENIKEKKKFKISNNKNKTLKKGFGMK